MTDGLSAVRNSSLSDDEDLLQPSAMVPKASPELSPAVVPRKRGRPAKLNKKPVTASSGRGRGRPPKNAQSPVSPKAVGSPVSTKKVVTMSDSGNGGTFTPRRTNGAPVVGTPFPKASRGRPPKAGKAKIAQPIESTGRGRGRPKGNGPIAAKTAAGTGTGLHAKKKPGRPGRPRKVATSSDDEGANDSGSDDVKAIDSDEEDEDEEVERRPLGRPPTGAVNLNIVRTGRGVGRPSKKAAAQKDAATSTKRVAVSSADNGVPPRKRGRPATGGKKAIAYVPSGRGRGRPKTKAADEAIVLYESDNDDGDDEAAGSEGLDEPLDDLAVA